MGLCPVPVLGDIYLILNLLNLLIALHNEKSIHAWSVANVMGLRDDWVFPIKEP